MPRRRLTAQLYRSLLQLIRQHDRDGLPLLGLAGHQGQELTASALVHVPAPHAGTLQADAATAAYAAWPANQWPHGPRHLLAPLFRQRAAATTEDHAFAALRLLAAQHQALLHNEECTLAACKAWRRHLASEPLLRHFFDDAPHHAHRHRSHHKQRHHQDSAAEHHDHQHKHHKHHHHKHKHHHRHHQSPAPAPAAWQLLGHGLERAAELLSTLHEQAQSEIMLVLDDDAPDDDGDGEAEGGAGWEDDDEAGAEQRAAVLDALDSDGLRAAVDVMGQQLRAQAPELGWAHDPPGGHHQQQHSAAAAPSGEGGGGEARELRQQLEAVRQYLYRTLRLRHEPIEWLYDGLRPLLLGEALRHRKAAPLAMAVLGCVLGARVGLPLAPFRAAPPQVRLGCLPRAVFCVSTNVPWRNLAGGHWHSSCACACA